MFEYELIERARSDRRHIVLPEGDDERVLRAAEILLRRGVVDLTLLGTARRDPPPRPPRSASSSTPRGSSTRSTHRCAREFAATYHELRRHKGVTEEGAFDTVGDVSYFGTLMVQAGEADGMVSGAAHTTGDTIRPAFEIIKAEPGRLGGLERVPDVPRRPRARLRRLRGEPAARASSSSPTSRSAPPRPAQTFGIEPRVAMLSYSTGAVGQGRARGGRARWPPSWCASATRS